MQRVATSATWAGRYRKPPISEDQSLTANPTVMADHEPAVLLKVLGCCSSLPRLRSSRERWCHMAGNCHIIEAIWQSLCPKNRHICPESRHFLLSVLGLTVMNPVSWSDLPCAKLSVWYVIRPCVATNKMQL